MELSELWFVLIAVLFTGFFFLEGFDFGVGMSTRLLAKTEGERRVLINTIGPFWDANEVWLLTAGGAMFAAFPHWYATMFSGYYLPLVIVLLALIGRGVSFEYRSKVDNEKWKRVWDNAIFYGSLLPPFLLGVAFSGLLKGLPIDQNMEMKAGLFDMVNPYTLVGGITVTMLCFVHGLIFISLKTEGGLRDRAKATARRLLRPLALLVVLFVVMTVFMTDIFQGGRSVILGPLAVLGAAALAGAGYFLSKEREGWAFAMTALVIVALLAIVFVGLFPRVMISTIDPAYNLTVYNTSSGTYSLTVMTIVTAALLPFALGYQIWNYYVFRKRLSEKGHLEY